MQPSIQQLNRPIFSCVWDEAQSSTEQSLRPSVGCYLPFIIIWVFLMSSDPENTRFHCFLRYWFGQSGVLYHVRGPLSACLPIWGWKNPTQWLCVCVRVCVCVLLCGCVACNSLVIKKCLSHGSAQCLHPHFSECVCQSVRDRSFSPTSRQQGSLCCRGVR